MSRFPTAYPRKTSQQGEGGNRAKIAARVSTTGEEKREREREKGPIQREQEVTIFSRKIGYEDKIEDKIRLQSFRRGGRKKRKFHKVFLRRA